MNYYTTYYWQIIGYDQFGEISEGVIWQFTTEEKTNRPPVRPSIDGLRALLVPNIDYEYDIATTDPDGDDVFYYIDWGDGTFEDWFGPCKSGENVTMIHSWPEVTRMYEIRVKVKDIYGAESDWGTMYVIIIKSRAVSESPFARLIFNIVERFPLLGKILLSRPIINLLMNL